MSTEPVPVDPDRAPLRIGVTGSRKYDSPAMIRGALLAAHERARPHAGRVLVHGMCDPRHPVTGRLVPWRTAERLPAAERLRLLGADWLAEQAVLEMAEQTGTWAIRRRPAEWWHAGRFDRGAGFARNARMVAEDGPFSEWLAFALPCSDHRCYRSDPHPSHGTAHCADLAAKAGIPVHWFSPDRALLPVLDGRMGT